jgi:hypothetical protein
VKQGELAGLQLMFQGSANIHLVLRRDERLHHVISLSDDTDFLRSYLGFSHEVCLTSMLRL